MKQAEFAYQEIRKQILICKLPDNTRIREQEWAARLKVGRPAIRESLTRLLGEGLVRSGPKGGHFVRELTLEDIKELRAVREILETGALQLACERITRSELKAMEQTCSDFADLVSKGYFQGAWEADLRFHQLLISASGNARLVHMYENSHMRLFNRDSGAVDAKDLEATQKDHSRILLALRQKNKSAGIEALRRHFQRGEQFLLNSE